MYFHLPDCHIGSHIVSRKAVVVGETRSPTNARRSLSPISGQLRLANRPHKCHKRVSKRVSPAYPHIALIVCSNTPGLRWLKHGHLFLPCEFIVVRPDFVQEQHLHCHDCSRRIAGVFTRPKTSVFRIVPPEVIIFAIAPMLRHL